VHRLVRTWSGRLGSYPGWREPGTPVPGNGHHSHEASTA